MYKLLDGRIILATSPTLSLALANLMRKTVYMTRHTAKPVRGQTICGGKLFNSTSRDCIGSPTPRVASYEKPFDHDAASEKCTAQLRHGRQLCRYKGAPAD